MYRCCSLNLLLGISGVWDLSKSITAWALICMVSEAPFGRAEFTEGMFRAGHWVAAGATVVGPRIAGHTSGPPGR